MKSDQVSIVHQHFYFQDKCQKIEFTDGNQILPIQLHHMNYLDNTNQSRALYFSTKSTLNEFCVEIKKNFLYFIDEKDDNYSVNFYEYNEEGIKYTINDGLTNQKVLKIIKHHQKVKFFIDFSQNQRVEYPHSQNNQLNQTDISYSMQESPCILNIYIYMVQSYNRSLKTNGELFEVNFKADKHLKLRQLLQRTQNNVYPHQFTGFIFEKKLFFRQDITIEQMYQLNKSKFGKNNSEQDSLQINVVIHPDFHLDRVLNQKPYTLQKKFKQILKLKNLKSALKFIHYSKYNDESLFEALQYSENLTNYENQRTGNRVCVVLDRFYQLALEYLKEGQVFMFTNFLLATTLNSSEVSQQIEKPQRYAIVSLNTQTAKIIDNNVILLRPFTNYFIQTIEKVEEDTSNSYVYIKLIQIPAPSFKKDILIWLDCNHRSNNYEEIQDVKATSNYQQLILLSYDQDLRKWNSLYLEILRIFRKQIDIKFVMNNARKERPSDVQKRKCEKLKIIPRGQQIKSAGVQMFIQLQNLNIKEQNILIFCEDTSNSQFELKEHKQNIKKQRTSFYVFVGIQTKRIQNKRVFKK